MDIRINTLDEARGARVTIEITDATVEEVRTDAALSGSAGLERALPAESGQIADLEIQLGLAGARIVELEARLHAALDSQEELRKTVWAEKARADAAEGAQRMAEVQRDEIKEWADRRLLSTEAAERKLDRIANVLSSGEAGTGAQVIEIREILGMD